MARTGLSCPFFLHLKGCFRLGPRYFELALCPDPPPTVASWSPRSGQPHRGALDLSREAGTEACKVGRDAAASESHHATASESRHTTASERRYAPSRTATTLPLSRVVATYHRRAAKQPSQRLTRKGRRAAA
uniref:Uncharacterized protein n=1 Tax=Arundo donax TaxID=35708 RepID=A0A0A8YCC0_ARUDO